MSQSPPLVACPECACHVKIAETHCPHCGARLRKADGSVARTGAAVLMGLTVMASGAACSSEVETGSSSSSTASSSSSGGGQGGQGGAGGGGTGVGGIAPPYGVPETDDDKDGYYSFSGGDCNDMDPKIHPGAPETPGDNIDSNCNGNDNN